MTAARVIIIVFASLDALVAAGSLVIGVIALVAGSQMSSSRAGGEIGQFVGGIAGAFAGMVALFFLVAGVVGGGIAALWFWDAAALGRGSTVARILTTIVLGLEIAIALFWALAVLSAFDTGLALAQALVATALPVTVLILLWAPESARRFFSPVPALPYAPYPTGGFAPLPSAPAPRPAPAATRAWPLDASTDKLAPAAGPAPRCGYCGTGAERGWAHCGHCGMRLPDTRVYG